MRILFYPVKLIIVLISFLPFSVIYLLSDLLYLVLYKIAGYRLAVVRSNLKKAFPDAGAEFLKQTEKNFYHNLCDVIAEFLKMPSITARQLERRVTFTNPELLEQFSHQGRSVIGVGSHMCNWEWGGLAVSHKFHGYECLGVYKPLSNVSFDGWFKKLRSRFGMHMIPMKGTLRAVASRRDQPLLLNLIADQTPTLSETEYEPLFLGIPTPVFLGAEKIAAAADMPVLYFTMRRTKRGFYSVTLLPITEHPKTETGHSITDKHLALLEKEILHQPGNWLWSHRRWKHSGKFSHRATQENKV
ncbi:MAG TPA: lysophospholipid acyltransferase family protein [Bacteroidia bacterium]|nr:lysophospholipid acyltransferase family protein [Bacteroidia bacterium]